jgi:tRNA threonylcarbamoyladenosine biosynthesis protein TsaB
VKLLALETGGQHCSVALAVDDDIRSLSSAAPRANSERLLPLVEQLLGDGGLSGRDLDALAFARGPGSFTGVRLGAAAAQGLAFSLDLPVVPVSSLAALALAAYYETGARRILTALDARIGEVYWGAYIIEPERLTVPCIDEAVATPATVALPAEHDGWSGAGSGWRVYAEVLAGRLTPVAMLPDCHGSAREVAVLGLAGLADGGGRAARDALPVYLRDKVTG